MNPPIVLYTGLLLLWLGLAAAIPLGFLDRFVGGEAGGWRSYLAVAVCLLMAAFNVIRILRLRAAQARIREAARPDDQPF